MRDSELIVGFSLDRKKVKKWIKEHDPDGFNSQEEINDLLKEQFPEIPEKIGYPSSTWSIYIVCYENYDSDEDDEGQIIEEYYLTFYEGGIFKIKDIAITPELLDLAKKIYKELIDEELVCSDVTDIEIYPVQHSWG